MLRFLDLLSIMAWATRKFLGQRHVRDGRVISVFLCEVNEYEGGGTHFRTFLKDDTNATQSTSSFFDSALKMTIAAKNALVLLHRHPVCLRPTVRDCPSQSGQLADHTLEVRKEEKDARSDPVLHPPLDCPPARPLSSQNMTAAPGRAGSGGCRTACLGPTSREGSGAVGWPGRTIGPRTRSAGGSSLAGWSGRARTVGWSSLA